MYLYLSKPYKRSRDPEHIPFGGNLSFIPTSVSISTRYLKCCDYYATFKFFTVQLTSRRLVRQKSVDDRHSIACSLCHSCA